MAVTQNVESLILGWNLPMRDAKICHVTDLLVDFSIELKIYARIFLVSGPGQVRSSALFSTTPNIQAFEPELNPSQVRCSLRTVRLRA